MSHSDYVGAIELLSPFQNDKDSARLVKEIFDGLLYRFEQFRQSFGIV